MNTTEFPVEFLDGLRDLQDLRETDSSDS